MRSRPEGRRTLTIAISTLVVLLTAASLALAQPPSVSFTYAPVSPAPGQTVTFTSTSSVPEGIKNQAWDLDGDGAFGEAGEPSGPGATTASRSFPTTGSYTVQLLIIDQQNDQAIATQTVTVTSPSQLPSAGTARPPPPSQTGDGDGTVNKDDLCPASTSGFRAIKHGCSLVDFIVSPAALLARAAKAVADARAELTALRELKSGHGHGRLLQKGLDGLRLSSRRLRTNSCRASSTAVEAMRRAAKGNAGVESLVKKKQRTVVRQATRFFRKHPNAGDASKFDMRYYELEFALQSVERAVSELRGLQGLVRQACSATGEGHVARGRVRSVAGSLATLTNGTTLVLGAANRVRGLAPGRRVRARGLLLKRRSLKVRSSAKPPSPKQSVLIADSLVPQQHEKVTVASCRFQPVIAPVQDLNRPAAQIAYHDERGYRGPDGRYLLEGGMGIGATRGPLCAAKNTYLLSVFLDYRDASGSDVTAYLGKLKGDPSQEQPLLIPNDVSPTVAVAKLRFELEGVNCFQADINTQFCGPTEPVSKGSSFVILRQQGGWSGVAYDRTVFNIEDDSTTDFETATLTGPAAPPVAVVPPLPAPAVFGVGYGTKSAGSSTYPGTETIDQGETFSVHDDVPAPTTQDYTDGVAGVPGGLLFAWVTGNRGAFAYQYVAQQPSIVTDRVTACTNPVLPEDSFYRLPWASGGTEQVTQGNNGTLTHNGGQAFAFDFILSNGEKGYATRGGLADLVIESRNANSRPNIDPWVPGNVLRVRHQDDSYSWYEHMQQNGVNPSANAIVERGDEVITIGSTGNSSTAHVHYHVTTVQGVESPTGRNASRGGTIQIRFEIGNPTLACAIPAANTSYVSTNAKPAP